MISPKASEQAANAPKGPKKGPNSRLGTWFSGPNRGFRKALLASFCLGLVLLVLISRSAPGAEWDWSPIGKHQRAVCIVYAGDAQATGVYVQDGALRGVVTAHHVIGAGSPHACCFGDRTVPGKNPQVDKYGHDLGWLFLDDEPGVRPIRLAPGPVRPGSQVEVVAYGGPATQQRHWFATCRQSLGELVLLDGYVISGDSGGAILDGKHRLAGIAIGGEPPSSRADWGVYRGTVAVAQGPLRNFLGRVRKRFCPHGGCPPEGRQLPEHYYPPSEQGEREQRPQGEYHTEEGRPQQGPQKSLEERFNELRERVLENERRGSKQDDLVPVEPEKEKPPILADHLEPLRTQIDQVRDAQQEQTKTLSDRLQKIQGALALVDRLRERIEESEERIGSADPKAVARDAARGVARDYAPGLIEALVGALPGLLAALGWTGPPALAAALIARLLARRTKRRIRERFEPPPARPNGRRGSLNDDYAKQLTGVHALSGRSPVADATLGREYDRQLAEAEQSSDGHLARLARQIRRRVQDTFWRIHDESPTPGEPVEV